MTDVHGWANDSPYCVTPSQIIYNDNSVYSKVEWGPFAHIQQPYSALLLSYIYTAFAYQGCT